MEQECSILPYNISSRPVFCGSYVPQCLVTYIVFVDHCLFYFIRVLWPLSCISYLRLLITTFVSFDHCLVFPTYGFWLPHVYLLTTVLYFVLTASDYHICIFWRLSCTFCLRLLITTFVSFDHCIVLPTYGFRLPHLYPLTTVLYCLLTASDDHICIVWPLSCTSYLRLLITTFISFDHCLVFPTYGFDYHFYIFELFLQKICFIFFICTIICISVVQILVHHGQPF